MLINQNIAQGHFARKQLLSKDRLIAWSHRKRFEIGLDLIRQLRPQKVLDYGSGDGTFVALLHDGPHSPALMVGAEIAQKDVNDCNQRFAAFTNVSFELISNLSVPAHTGAYDAVVCMEVLEHVTDLDTVIRQLNNCLAIEGHLLISVPVEIGPPLIIKQAARRVAGWRNLGHYKYNSRYTPLELWKSLVAGDEQHIVRSVHTRPDGTTDHDHKGFNWRCLKRRLETSFDVLNISTSPVRSLGPQFASQVWLLCRKR